jgi:hypothetical protein
MHEAILKNKDRNKLQREKTLKNELSQSRKTKNISHVNEEIVLLMG